MSAHSEDYGCSTKNDVAASPNAVNRSHGFVVYGDVTLVICVQARRCLNHKRVRAVAECNDYCITFNVVLAAFNCNRASSA